MIATKAPTSPAQRYYITPEGGALNPPVRRSRSQAEPLAPRAKGPAAPSTLTPVRACQPSGILESTARSRSRSRSRAPKGACTFKPQRGLSRAHQKNPPLSGWILFYFFAFFQASLSFSFSAFLSLFSSARSSNSSTISSGSFTLYQKE